MPSKISHYLLSILCIGCQQQGVILCKFFLCKILLVNSTNYKHNPAFFQPYVQNRQKKNRQYLLLIEQK